MKYSYFLLTLTCLLFISCNSGPETLLANPADSGSDTLVEVSKPLDSLFLTKPEGISFSVSDVRLAKNLMKTRDAQIVFEAKINKRILFIPEKFRGQQLVSCYNNGLIQTIQESYDQHRPLILSPDHIWLAICQGVSIHINEKFDSLQRMIFVKNKPKELKFRDDSLATSGKSWEALIASLSGQTKKYTKSDFYAFFVPDFSTTSEVEKTAYQITLLESYKKAFVYIGESGCGIPSITLTGTTKDWQEILHKLPMLKKLGLKEWADCLEPVIREFIRASEGKADKSFWQSMYKDASEYGQFYLSGWIIKFFPYIRTLDYQTSVYDSKRGESRVEEHYKKNEFLTGDRYLMSTLSTADFPTGLAKIPVTFTNYFDNTTRQMEIYSGFFAIKQYGDKTIEPLIGWAVCEKDAKAANHKNAAQEPEKLTHRFDGWSPQIRKDNPAIYDVKRFKTAPESMRFLQQYLQDSIAANKRFAAAKQEIVLTFVVLSNGKTTDFKLEGKNDPPLLAYLEGLIRNLPGSWFPAMEKYSEITEDYDDTNKDLKMKVNSLVRLSLE